VETHYERKEQLLFPFLEKKGFMGPSKVMWGKHNEVRGLLKAALDELAGVKGKDELSVYIEKKLNPLLDEVLGMIFKEENILFPASLEKLDAADWVEILRESDGIGYVFIEKPAETTDLIRHLKSALIEETVVHDEAVNMPTGSIKLADLMPVLNTLPFDLTFIDKDDTLRYFSDSKERIFLRTKAVLGRKVQNCHPPQSVEKVEKILTSFKQGKRDSYEFWIKFHDRLIHIRYFAVRDGQRNYLGTLEVTQDITGIKQLEGERRLLDERD
jgi:PAS domain S-box-containing protein